MQYAIAHLDQDGKADCDQNPYISVDFENNLESCLEAANMMEDRHIYLGVCENSHDLRDGKTKEDPTANHNNDPRWRIFLRFPCLSYCDQRTLWAEKKKHRKA